MMSNHMHPCELCQKGSLPFEGFLNPAEKAFHNAYSRGGLWMRCTPAGNLSGLLDIFVSGSSDYRGQRGSLNGYLKELPLVLTQI